MFENIEIMQRICMFAVAAAATALFLLFWGKREERRYKALKVAEKLEAWGFTLLSKLFRAYAIGNYIGKDSVGRCIREIIDEIQSGGLPAMLRTIGWKVVKGVFLTNDEDRAKLKELLAKPKPNPEPESPGPDLPEAT